MGNDFIKIFRFIKKFFKKSSLKGCYLTAEDVGTSDEDMAAIFSKTHFTTCIPPEVCLLKKSITFSLWFLIAFFSFIHSLAVAATQVHQRYYVNKYVPFDSQ